MSYQVCPRNCYESCSILSTVENNILTRVEGNPDQNHTQGKLCAKGYAYPQLVYHPQRLKEPLLQYPPGSGNWKKISWSEALKLIAERILKIKAKYNSTLPLALNKYSGNFGILHRSVEGFFQSLGPVTMAQGSPCWSAGLDAQTYDFGNFVNSSPQEINRAKTIVLWGVNPAWTAPHSMSMILRAQEMGAYLIVIDPVLSATGEKADLYLQIKPGTDALLAHGVAKVMLEKGWHRETLRPFTLGWDKWLEYLKTEVKMSDVIEETGLSYLAIKRLALQLSQNSAIFFWLGFGLQRHSNGGQTIRGIDALGVLTGCIGVPGGGVHYAHLETWKFKEPFSNSIYESQNRYFPINDFHSHLLEASPPVEFLWISCRNPLGQDPHTKLVKRAFNEVDFIVTVDLFFNDTCAMSDLVLPATTFFEEWDIVSSYWHHWVGVNQPAIKPLKQARSDLWIVTNLAKTLNALKAGSSQFTMEYNPQRMIEEVFSIEMLELLDIDSCWELLQKPKEAKISSVAWFNKKFSTPSGKIELYSQKAADRGLPPLPVYVPPLKPSKNHPLTLLTSHHQHGLNSQFQHLEWLQEANPVPLLYINPKTAALRGLSNGDYALVYNEQDQLKIPVHLTYTLPQDIVLVYQGWFSDKSFCINKLVKTMPTDMGELATGSHGQAFYDTFVQVKAGGMEN